MAKFFTSDIHFCDDRLSFFGRETVFNTSEEFDEQIIKNWNKIINKDDIVYYLGDVSLSEKGLEKIGRCNGYKILIKGNYDESKTSKYNVSDELLLKYFNKVSKGGFIKINNEKIYLNHFPENGKTDCFNLVGHIHEKWKVQRNMINVGIDCWHFMPVSEKQIEFTIKAIREHFDINVFAGELKCNVDNIKKDKKTIKESISKELTKNVLYPPSIGDEKCKIIFLAGPIQGAPNWHEEAIEYLLKDDNNKFKIACPKLKYKPDKFDYDKQVDWETKYLELASKNGIIVFWLAKEEKHDSKRSYAQTTRFEMAEWLVNQKNDNNIEIVIGIEDGFSGQQYIEKKVRDQYKLAGKIYYNLKELCEYVKNKID